MLPDISLILQQQTRVKLLKTGKNITLFTFDTISLLFLKHRRCSGGCGGVRGAGAGGMGVTYFLFLFFFDKFLFCLILLFSLFFLFFKILPEFSTIHNNLPTTHKPTNPQTRKPANPQTRKPANPQSVLMSGFDHYWKNLWLGDQYMHPNQVKANFQDKSNISNIRTFLCGRFLLFLF